MDWDRISGCLRERFEGERKIIVAERPLFLPAAPLVLIDLLTASDD